jgi:LPXTG-site transpeptidase (sortase) family protein
MHHVRLFLLLAVLLLAACGPAAQDARPAIQPTEVAVAAAPSQQLAATSRELIDTPVLEEQTVATPLATPTIDAALAPPATIAPLAAPTLEHSQPVRIVIADIGMDQPLVAVGLDERAVPIVPKHDAGWFEYSARPGTGDNIVLWGHALRFKDSPQIPAPFGQLQKLRTGAMIVLYDKANTAHSYTITQQVWATPDQIDYILPKKEERLTLISCIGDKIITSRGVDMTHRLVTIARPAPLADAQ